MKLYEIIRIQRSNRVVKTWRVGWVGAGRRWVKGGNWETSVILPTIKTKSMHNIISFWFLKTVYQQKKNCERLFTKMLAADISLWNYIKPSFFFFLKLSALFVFPTASMYCFYSHKNPYLNYEKQNQTHFHQGPYSWLYHLGELLGCYRKADSTVPVHGALRNNIRRGLGSYLKKSCCVLCVSYSSAVGFIWGMGPGRCCRSGHGDGMAW